MKDRKDDNPEQEQKKLTATHNKSTPFHYEIMSRVEMEQLNMAMVLSLSKNGSQQNLEDKKPPSNLRSLNPRFVEDALEATKQIWKDLSEGHEKPLACVGIHFTEIQYSNLPIPMPRLIAKELMEITVDWIYPTLTSQLEQAREEFTKIIKEVNSDNTIELLDQIKNNEKKLNRLASFLKSIVQNVTSLEMLQDISRIQGSLQQKLTQLKLISLTDKKNEKMSSREKEDIDLAILMSLSENEHEQHQEDKAPVTVSSDKNSLIIDSYFDQSANTVVNQKEKKPQEPDGMPLLSKDEDEEDEEEDQELLDKALKMSLKTKFSSFSEFADFCEKNPHNEVINQVLESDDNFSRIITNIDDLDSFCKKFPDYAMLPKAKKLNTVMCTHKLNFNQAMGWIRPEMQIWLLQGVQLVTEEKLSVNLFLYIATFLFPINTLKDTFHLSNKLTQTCRERRFFNFLSSRNQLIAHQINELSDKGCLNKQKRP
jgi:hypothetical protein